MASHPNPDGVEPVPPGFDHGVIPPWRVRFHPDRGHNENCWEFGFPACACHLLPIEFTLTAGKTRPPRTKSLSEVEGVFPSPRAPNVGNTRSQRCPEGPDRIT